MRVTIAAISLVFWNATCFGQSFDVASIKPSQRQVGKDAMAPISIGPAGLSGRNVTLKRLIVQAYGLQPYQIFGGPNWLDVAEYDIDAKAGGAVSREQLGLMLRTLLADRVKLSVHRETKEMRVYELVIDKNGPKIRAVTDAEAATSKPSAGGARNFRGDLQQFANLLSIQLSIPMIDDPSRPSVASGPPVPVVDKTGLSGIFDIDVNLKLELGVDMFALWQRALQDQLGFKLENRKGPVEVLVVDSAERIPAAN
jgi:uncharacterized protein (TIGR03435 family)